MEMPNASQEAIRERFGAPELVAASCLESTTTADLLKRMRHKRRISKIVIVIAALVLLTWCVHLCCVNSKLQKYIDGYSIQEIQECVINNSGSDT